MTDPDDLDSGGRAIRAFCRPYVRHWSGAPTRMTFDLATGEFTAELEREAEIDGPTVIFVPRVHYPDGPTVKVSTGETTFHPATQLLSWFTPPDAGAITARLTR